MAKLTLTFKDRTLGVTLLTEGEIAIGRDPANGIQIDSLAVAPRHAVVRSDARGTFIRQLDPRFPISVNNLKVAEKQLVHGDSIDIGKHVLFYDDEPHREPADPFTPELPSASPAVPTSQAISAGLQAISGSQIGRIVPLRGGMTRLGRDNATVIITRRREGYFISALVGSELVRVNDTPLGEKSVPLKNGDTVQVDDNLMQFFCIGE
jgi:predicted component of type VI protein secretion system